MQCWRQRCGFPPWAPRQGLSAPREGEQDTGDTARDSGGLQQSLGWAGCSGGSVCGHGITRLCPCHPRTSSTPCLQPRVPAQGASFAIWGLQPVAQLLLGCCAQAHPRVPLGGQHAGVSPALSPSCPVTFVTGGCLLLRVVPVPCWLRVPGGTRGRSTRPRRAGPPRVLQLRLLCMQACGWQLSAASCLCRAIRICRCLRCLTSSSRG